MGFGIGVCLGLNLGPHGCARCPVELGDDPLMHKTDLAHKITDEPAEGVKLGERPQLASRPDRIPRSAPDATH
jgi:hypothetical protein